MDKKDKQEKQQRINEEAQKAPGQETVLTDYGRTKGREEEEEQKEEEE